MEQLLTQLAAFGLPGVMMGIAIFFIYRMQTIYQQERMEWKDAMIKQSDNFIEITSKQHDQLINVVKDTHTILTEIKSLIQFKP